MIWKTRCHDLDLSREARVMGILNVTPDSFSDGGQCPNLESALLHARRMIHQGACIIDIGGESTRPGAEVVGSDEEISRTVPVIAALRKEWDGLISIDTTKATVAEAALAAGADIVNDVSGLLADSAMPALCAEARCGVVVMHMQGTPRTMQAMPWYRDVIGEMKEFFLERLAILSAAGIDERCLCFDPGIGFGKTLDHNLALIHHAATLAPTGRPLLLGVSKKSFMSRMLAEDNMQARAHATVAITAIARRNGIMLHRVHDVAPNMAALQITEALLASGED